MTPDDLRRKVQGWKRKLDSEDVTPQQWKQGRYIDLTTEARKRSALYLINKIIEYSALGGYEDRVNIFYGTLLIHIADLEL